MKTTGRVRKVVASPVVILRPDANGNLVQVAVISHPPVHRAPNDWEPDSVVQRFRLMALQETGEEMCICHVRDEREAEKVEKEWLAQHPEHVISIERI